MLAKYTKNPEVVEAMYFSSYDVEIMSTIVNWVNYGQDMVKAWHNSQGVLYINTIDGYKVACVEDYVVKGNDGEFYLCPAHIFRATYPVKLESL